MSLPVDIHTHLYKSNKWLEVLSVDFQNIELDQSTDTPTYQLVSIAFHPLFWSEQKSINNDYLKELLEKNKIVALGEAGLDKASHMSIQAQMELFRKIMKYSDEYQLPIVIHCVGRWSELQLLFKERINTAPPWIIHGFRKAKLADQFLELGAYLSFGKALLYDQRLQECVAKLPLDRVFLETDNDDVDLLDLYKQLSFIKSLPLPAVIEQLFHNFKQVFRYG